MTTFRELVNNELARMRNRGHVCNGWHEAYGLIAEEFDEFWDEVKKRNNKRDKVNAVRELSQIAALCERVANDLGLVEAYNNDQPQTIGGSNNGRPVPNLS